MPLAMLAVRDQYRVMTEGLTTLECYVDGLPTGGAIEILDGLQMLAKPAKGRTIEILGRKGTSVRQRRIMEL